MITENKNITNAQHGFATILIVLLVGLSIGISALGTAYYINMSQKSLVSSHALTNAQSGAWTGVEIFGNYLELMDAAGISSMNGQSVSLNIQDGRTLQVKNIFSEELGTDSNQFRVTADIQNISEQAKSSSTIQAIYDISLASDSTSTGDSGSTVTFPSAMNFYGNLDANGGINLSNAGDRAVINVAGDFSTGSGLTGIKELKVLGNVNISGGGITGLENIYSNGNVSLTASGTAKLVSAKGTVTTSGGVSVTDIYADKNVVIGSSSTINSIDTKESISMNGNSTINKATAGDKIIVSNGTILNALANSDIKYGVWNKLETAKSGGAFNCVSQNWNNYTKISAATFSSCPTNTPDKIITLPSGSKVAFPIGALATVTMANKPLINALDYEDQSNYVFSVNDKNQIMIYVREVEGITEGMYHLGKIRVNYNESWGYLCAAVDANNFCTSNIVGNFAKKYNYANQFITYSNGVWTLKDTQNQESSLASGILFFKGTSVNISAGNYANTIISTGDINYGGSVTLKAPNLAGAPIVCGSAYFPMPTNFCSSKSTLSLASIGNIALLSGSCTDGSSVEKCSENYTGGNITLSSQATIEGNIIAGNKLDTGGQTILKGSILAAALGKNNGSKLGGSTTIDFNGSSDESTTITLPGGQTESEGETVTQRAKIKWVRYI